jgi:SAM-dependent methyltransferase
MVGSRGDPGRGTAELTPGLRAGYSAAAGGWAAGPERIYGALAAALAGAAGSSLQGLRVLDLGSGPGTAGRAALRAGARQVVAADLAFPMLASGRGSLSPVVADAAALPFRDQAFDLVLAAFLVSHLADVPAVLAEARRAGTRLAASAFAAGWTHPAKPAVDAVLREFGYRPPPWYAEFKHVTEPLAGDPRWLAAQAAAAGFTEVSTVMLTVPTGVSSPADLAAWRLGMAHTAPFTASLAPAKRTRLLHAAADAVAGCPAVTVPMLILTAS